MLRKEAWIRSSQIEPRASDAGASRIVKLEGRFSEIFCFFSDADLLDNGYNLLELNISSHRLVSEILMLGEVRQFSQNMKYLSSVTYAFCF